MQTVSSLPSSSQNTFALPWGVIILNLLSTISLAFPFYTTYVALPRMMVTMRANLDTMQWVLTGFSMSQTLMMPLVGWMTDRFGLRHVFLACLSLTLLGSVGCGLAWSAGTLIGWRIAQGLGAGPLSALAAVIMFDAFPTNKRAFALALISTHWALGALLALPSGGYVIEMLSWRIIFFCGLPFGVASLALAVRYLPQTIEAGKRQLDFWGVVALLACLAPLLFGLSQGQRLGWDATIIRGSFALAGVAAVAFAVRECCCANPLIDLKLFTNIPFTMTCLVRFLNHIGFNAYNLLVALYLQLTLDYTPLQAGLVVLPSAVAVAPACILIGRWTDRLGPRLMILSGLVAQVITVYLFATVNPWTPAVWIVTLVIVLRISSEFLFAPLNYAGLRLLPSGAMRMGAGILSLMWSIGGSIGNASTAVALQQRRVIQGLALAGDLYGDGSERQHVLVEIHRLLQDAGYTQNELESTTQGFLQHYMHQEMSVAAFQDCFLLVASVYLFTLLPALLIRLPKTTGSRVSTEMATNDTPAAQEPYSRPIARRATMNV